ncbi:MAG TPA: FG-GAP-like repeat-containing protein [Gemmatimonadaceae bacterium]|nr:FG-GAP-like repeat-containing protein [Gemmatimonadaceae bacterium]
MINPATVSLGNIGDSGSLTVTTQAGCPWSASSDAAAFLSFADGSNRIGSGTVGFTTTTNFSTAARSGTGTVAGVIFTVNQQALDAARQVRERARADFNGDGFSDLLWQDRTNGYLAVWTLQGGHTTKNAVSFGPTVDDTNWRIVGTGDFNRDGKPDIVWHHRTEGRIYLWYMDGTTRIGHTAFSIYGISGEAWKVVGVGDFNQDGKPDLVWQHDTLGWLVVWLMDNATLIGGLDMSPGQVDAEWKIAGVADLNADGHSDLLWRNNRNGTLGAWLMNGVTRTQYVPLAPEIVDDFDWQIASVTDINGDGSADVVWQHATQGWIAVWYMNGTRRIDYGSFPVAVETNWKIVGPK